MKTDAAGAARTAYPEPPALQTLVTPPTLATSSNHPVATASVLPHALQHDKASQRRSALVGIVFTIVACAFFAVLDTGTKYVGGILPVMMTLWLRYLCHSLLTTAFVVPQKGWQVFRTNQPRFQLLRAVLFFSTSIFAFFSIQHMPLAEFSAVVAMTPLMITLVAALWLKQKVSPLRWVLVVLGLVSTLVIIRPGGDNFSIFMLLPLAMLFLGTGYQILSSQMAGKEDPATTQLYTGWLATLMVSILVPFVWTTEGMDNWRLWLGVLCMGVGSAVAHLLVLKAYARTHPATISPFLYTQIAFAMLCGWLFYGHMPDAWSLAGMATIALCGALSAWLTVRETR